MIIPDILDKNEILNINSFEKLVFDNISRTVGSSNSNTLFFDLYSDKTDRFTQIQKIIDTAPSAIVTDRPSDFENIKIPIVTVKKSRRAYSIACSRLHKIDYSKLIFIGITGTNRKTSTATILKNIFEHVGIKVGFIGTGKILSDNKPLTDFKYSMTTPDPELLYDAIKRIENDGCEIIIMEVSSHSLALDKTAPIPFTLSLFTGLSSEHMDFHKNMENYFKEKEKLIEASAKAIINCDDSWGKRLYNKYRDKAKSVGIEGFHDYNAIAIHSLGLDGSEYVVKSNNFSTKVKLNLPGRFNIYNSMIAFAAACELGIIPRDIKSAISKVTEIDGRMEVIKSDITVIVDYAHTPLALENLLKTVNECLKQNQKTTLVFGCGGERDREKRPRMASIAERFCDKIIVTDDNPRGENAENIIKEICIGFTNSCYGVIRNRTEAIEYAIKAANRGDFVIICGKGHEKYIYDSEGLRAFDEKSIITEAIKEREGRYMRENKA